MKVIHKIAAVVIEDDKFLMVRKKGKDLWTSLGGHPEEGETEEEALMREIREEMGCKAAITRKLGDFEAPAAFDPGAMLRLSTYLASLSGPIRFEDPELEEYRYFPKEEAEVAKFPDSIRNEVIPYCIQEGLLNW